MVSETPNKQQLGAGVVVPTNNSTKRWQKRLVIRPDPPRKLLLLAVRYHLLTPAAVFHL